MAASYLLKIVDCQLYIYNVTEVSLGRLP